MKVAAVVKMGKLNDPDLEKRGQVDVIDFPDPELGPNDVKVRVAYCSICGSDPHLSEGMFGNNLPIGIGHEMSGVVEALGEKATIKGLKVGDKVACNFIHFCGTCWFCQNAMQQFCTGRMGKSGPGMAEYVIWNESMVYKLPEGMDLKTGCLLEPVSVSVRAIDKLNAKYGSRVLVCGGGPIGQLCLQGAHLRGAADLTMVEPVANRRDLATRFGARHTIDPINQNLYEEAMKITEGRGFEYIIDASGSAAAAPGLLDIACRGATILYAAMYPDGYNLPLDMLNNLYRRELTLTGMMISPYTFPRSVQILKELDLEPLTECVYDLKDVAEAFQVHLSGKYPKVLVRCNNLD